MYFVKNKKQNRWIYIVALFFFFSLGGFFVFSDTPFAAANTRFDCAPLADGFLDCWNSGGENGNAMSFSDAAAYPFKLLFLGIFTVLGWFSSIAITIFEWAITPEYISGSNGLLNRASIYEMWKFIRDFFNLFFILTLLYIAFTIVFQVAKDYKKTLLSLVLAALFVNFSFPITRIIIDATNVPMYYFVNQIGSQTGGNNNNFLGTVLSASQLKGILIPGAEDGGSVNLVTTGLAQLIMAVVFLFIFSITLLVLALLFVIRLAALVILLIFSAVGFAASVIPGLQRYSSQWWEKLWQYALFGPAAMLMLFIATRFFSEISADNTRAQFLAAGIANNVQETAGFISSMAMFSVPIIMLWFAIGIGSAMSVAGAGAIEGTGKRFSKWAGKSVTKTPALWVGRKVDSKLAGSKRFSVLSPGAWRTALKQRGEEQKHKDEQPIKQTAAKRQDQLNKVISGTTDNWYKPWKIPGAVAGGRGSDHTDHEFAQSQQQASEYRKEISDVSTQSNYVINELKAALATGNSAKADAALQILAKNNDLNDMLTDLDQSKMADYGITDLDASGKAVVSSENMAKALKGILRDSGEDNADLLAKKLMVIGDHATAAGNFAFGGMTKFNQSLNNGHGGFEETSPAEQAQWASSKVKNLESQERQRKLHPDSLFKRTADGKFGDLNGEVAKEIIGTFTTGDERHADRSRDDLKQAIFDAYTNGQAEFMATYNNSANAIFKDYVDKVVAMKKGAPSASSGSPIIIPPPSAGGPRGTP